MIAVDPVTKQPAMYKLVEGEMYEVVTVGEVFGKTSSVVLFRGRCINGGPLKEIILTPNGFRIVGHYREALPA